ncbi:MAG: hypothetical protein IT370_27945 [Deltaproteobacteria bacterium]|nr:hypothetical protein [Deltaproteobacteria bacterium]
MAVTLAQCLAALEQHGVMTLTASPPLPDLVTLVAREPVKGSWWAHPAGNAIFNLANELEDHADVLVVKLVGGKVSFVARPLWPALLRVASDAGWRAAATARVPAAARTLLTAVEADGELRPDKATRAAARLLEASLLVLSRQEHTASGKHETVLTDWRRWARQARVTRAAGTLAAAIATIETACLGLPTSLSPTRKVRSR